MIPDSGFAVSVAQFLAAPLVVGSPFPSSASMVRRLFAKLPWTQIDTLVEFGPGSGTFTRFALKHLRADARLIAIDTEQRFTEHLKRKIRDRRLVAVTGSARDVHAIVKAHGRTRIDCVVSGLPFSTLDDADREAIVSRSAAMMGCSGIFLAYQMRRAIEPHLQRAFVTLERRHHWLNAPPCYLYRATRPRSVRRT